MDATRVTYRALSTDAIRPKRQTAGAAGYDLHSISEGVIPPHTTVSIRLGFSLQVPHDHFGMIMGRSGLALKHGLETKASYVKNHEEIVVHIYNSGETPFNYDKHMRVAQLVFLRMDAGVDYVDAAE
ncbi:dUTP pyrophosphatase [Pancytospora philotis]|nr:dUTP pyrophosphatase [Pancytospora philotis]